VIVGVSRAHQQPLPRHSAFITHALLIMKLVSKLLNGGVMGGQEQGSKGRGGTSLEKRNTAKDRTVLFALDAE
jgi:hypothetical protein